MQVEAQHHHEKSAASNASALVCARELPQTATVALVSPDREADAILRMEDRPTTSKRVGVVQPGGRRASIQHASS